jgi:hypothetical protein
VAYVLQDQLNVVKGLKVFKHPAQIFGLLPNSLQLYGSFKKANKDCMFMLDDEMWDALVE